jgi:hypothetical protein
MRNQVRNIFGMVKHHDIYKRCQGMDDKRVRLQPVIGASTRQLILHSLDNQNYTSCSHW